MENNTRISESRYSNPERLPERAETDSFNTYIGRQHRSNVDMEENKSLAVNSSQS